MANKREIKKTINYLTGELLAECVSCSHFNNVNPEDVDNVMLSILEMQDDLICRVSHVQPGMPAKAFFAKLRQDMASQVSEIIDQINAIG